MPAREQLACLNAVEIPEGKVLFRPGDEVAGFALVVSGRVDVYMTGRTAREILLYSVTPGATCVQTTPGLLGEDDYSVEAVEWPATGFGNSRRHDMFKKYVGSPDRAARFIFGAGILSLYFIYPDASWRMWTRLGIVPLATALFSTCPAYSILGLSTCPAK